MEYRASIIKKSSAEISRLQLLSAFFDEEILYKIFLRSQVIHQLFENNEELEIEKLDLFHLQFTDSIIELLKKIKKSNEKNVVLIYNEIDLNKELINQLSTTVNSQQNYKLDKQKQSLKINQTLKKLYEVLSELSSEFPFSKNINVFSAKYANNFYYDLTTEQFAKLINYEPLQVYRNVYATIEKKLVGKLCKYDFRSEFYAGFKSADLVIEIYKLIDGDIYFLFYPSRNLFLLCDLKSLGKLDNVNTVSEKERMLQEIQYKNDKLKSTIAVLKTTIPAEINSLLEDCYLKITDINFLNHLNNFDVQSNILKTMLNTKLF